MQSIEDWRQPPDPVRVVKSETMVSDRPSVRLEEPNLLLLSILAELLLVLVLSLRFSSGYIGNLQLLISDRNVVTRKGANKVAAICTATRHLLVGLQLALITAFVRQFFHDFVACQLIV